MAWTELRLPLHPLLQWGRGDLLGWFTSITSAAALYFLLWGDIYIFAENELKSTERQN